MIKFFLSLLFFVAAVTHGSAYAHQVNEHKNMLHSNMKRELTLCALKYQLEKIYDHKSSMRYYVGVVNDKLVDPDDWVFRNLKLEFKNIFRISESIVNTGGVYNKKDKSKGVAILVRDFKALKEGRYVLHTRVRLGGKSGKNAEMTVEMISGKSHVIQYKITGLL